jgi:hypothetical protein
MMSDPQQGARLRVSRREYIVARVAAEEKAAEVAATRGEAGAWHPAREAPQATTGDRWKDRFRAADAKAGRHATHRFLPRGAGWDWRVGRTEHG